MEGDHDISLGLSAAWGGDDHESHDHQEEHNSQGQPHDSDSQQSGGEGDGGSAEFSVEVKVKAHAAEPPMAFSPFRIMGKQEGGYQPEQNNPPPPPPPDYAPPVGPPPSHLQTSSRSPVGGGAPLLGARINQVMVRPEIGPPVPWASELFGCFEDCYGCPLVILAPCITFGQIAEIVDTGYNGCQTAGIIYALAFFLGIPCLYSYTYRTKMRHKFNLREDPLDDFCTHFWCEWCALAQEYREIRYRGIDPSLGYEMQQVAITKAMEAPVPPRMQAFN